MGGTGRLHHEIVWRKCDSLVGCFVVVKIIVVVPQEKYRRRSAKSAIERSDLLSRRAKQGTLVGATQNRCGAIKAGIFQGCFGSAKSGRRPCCKKIPIDVIPVGNECVG